MKALHKMFAVATVTLVSPMAFAHATLKSSNPEAGATVETAPKEVTLTFNEKVEQAFSTISVADSGGKDVTAHKGWVDAANPVTLRLAMPVLSTGTYTVTWAVAGHDGHRRKGDFKFTVK